MLRIGNRRKRQALAFEHLRQLGCIPVSQARAQQRHHPIPRPHPVVVADQTGVGKQIVKTEGIAKHPPLRVAHHGQKNLRAVLDAEHVVNAPGRNTLGHGRGGLAGHGELQHVLGHQKNIVFEQRGLHLLTAPGLCPLHQCGHRTHGTEQAAHDVVDAGSCPQRVARSAGHIGQPAHHLHHFVQRGAVVVGAGEKAFVADVNQAGVARA